MYVCGVGRKQVKIPCHPASGKILIDSHFKVEVYCNVRKAPTILSGKVFLIDFFRVEVYTAT